MRIKGWMKILALVVSIGALAFPMTALAAGGKDTTPPELTAVLEDETVKIESRDDNSGVEAVFIDGNRVNSLTDGKASVALKDYVGGNKNVSVYAVDYAGNCSETVKFSNPYYKEPETKGQDGNSGSSAQQQQSQKPSQQTDQTPAGTQADSSGSNAGASNQSGAPAGGNGAGTNSGNAGTEAAPGTGGGNALSGNAAGSSGNSQESTSSIPEGAFTPDGTGTVLDEATGEDGDKQFYTITTEDGNVFYLIVDGKRDSNNVYFLNAVTESDLMALAEKDNENGASSIPSAEICSCTEKCAAGEVDTACPVCRNDLKGCTGKEAGPAGTEEPAEPEKANKDGGSVGTVLFILAALLVVCGAGYYVKIVRPKQQAEDDGFEDDGYGEGFDPDEAFGETEYLSEDDFDDRIEDNEHEDGE